ncbi:MAG: aldo/keto reductase [Chloroflexota bacterium]|nr:aldo/keto reductase [Chloroflexota bacterium]
MKNVELKKRRLGKTNLLVTELGFGAMNIPSVSDGAETLSRALDLSINFVDSARIYRGSEYLIGDVMNGRDRRDCYLATKTISRSADGVQHDIDRSLSLLRVDRIDLYQLHDVREDDWEKVIGKGGALEGLERARSRGLIDHVGISSHSQDVIKKVVAGDLFETLQVDYSAYNPIMAHFVLQAKQKDIGVIVMKPLGGAGRVGSIGSSEYKGWISAKALLHYLLSDSNISVAIPGARFVWEVEELVELAHSYESMTALQRAFCEAEAKFLTDQGAYECRGCRYCTEGKEVCRADINIAEILTRFHNVANLIDEKLLSHDYQSYKRCNPTGIDCIGCGDCEELCPFSLSIMTLIDEIDRRLS